LKIIDFDTQLEKDIVSGMITSTEFLRKAVGVIDPDHFDIPASRTLARWALKHFIKYNEAPNKTIKNIFLERSKRLPDAESEWIAEYLEVLSKRSGKEKINESYLYDKTLNFMNKQKLRNAYTRGLELLEEGKLEEAVKAGAAGTSIHRKEG
jgi:hypothetical protein